MATTTNTLPIDITAHVLPLLELCRYASMASSAANGLQTMAGLLPKFSEQVNDAAPYLGELADSQSGDLVAGVLWVAIDLLSQYENQPSTEEA